MSAQQVTTTAAPTPMLSDAMAVLDRALQAKTDPGQLERLYGLIETMQTREAEHRFNAAFVQAQAEMAPIAADADNPQTRSRYATFAALHRAVMPIANRHGFGVTFGTEETGADTIRIVGYLGHTDGFVRRYEITVPRDTTGLRGQQAMTRMHALGSAYTYGKRYLLGGMFNLAIEDDDDGNAAGRSYKPRQGGGAPAEHFQRESRSIDEVTDPLTGEIGHAEPFTIEMHQGATAHEFMETMQRYILTSRTIAEWDDWKLKNQALLLKLKDTKPQLFQLFDKNIEPKYNELIAEHEKTRS
jgi:hypothetical protein